MHAPAAAGPNLTGPAESDDWEDGVEQRRALVEASAHGQRIDKVVHALAPEFSRSYLQELVRRGLVTLDARAVTKPAQKVAVGQQLAVTLQPTAESQAFVAEPMDLHIVHEDDALLVVNKPAGRVVHPAAGNWRGTLLNGLLAHAPLFATLPRAGIVHRLDKDTSGLMLVGKTLPAIKTLVEQIARRDVSRQYVAIAHRHPHAAWPWRKEGDCVRVDAAIGRDPRNRLRMAVVDLATQAGKPAQTDITLLDRQGEWALLHCALHTGRTHQIRVHAQHLGFALVGDAVYGGVRHPAVERQALHAWRLALDHPEHGRRLELVSALPADIQALADAVGLRWDPAVR